MKWIISILTMPFRVLRFFLRCPEDVFEDLVNMFSHFRLALLWNVRRERKILKITYDLCFEKGLVENYLNRNADYLDEKIHNLSITFELLVKALNMGSYTEEEICRKYNSLCDAAHRIGSNYMDVRRYEKEEVLSCMEFILTKLSKFKKTLKQHNKKVKGK